MPLFIDLENQDINIKSVLKEYYDKFIKEGLSFNKLEVKKSLIPKAGLGVFTKEKIFKNEIIELCHAIVFRNTIKVGNYKKTIARLNQYSYRVVCECDECKRVGEQSFLPLGFGAIYNSADNKESRNMDYYYSAKDLYMAYIAIREIEPEEELLTWWGDAYYECWCKPKQSQC